MYKITVCKHAFVCCFFLFTNKREREKSIELIRAVISIFCLSIRSNVNARNQNLKDLRGIIRMQTYTFRTKNCFVAAYEGESTHQQHQLVKCIGSLSPMLQRCEVKPFFTAQDYSTMVSKTLLPCKSINEK